MSFTSNISRPLHDQLVFVVLTLADRFSELSATIGNNKKALSASIMKHKHLFHLNLLPLESFGE